MSAVRPLRPNNAISGTKKNPKFFSNFDFQKAGYLFHHFKDQNFSGELDQSIELCLRDFKICALQNRLTNQQRPDYLANIFGEIARTFFFNTARDDMSFEEMAMLMFKEYNSDALQQQIKGVLDMLRLSTFVAKKEISSLLEAVIKVVNLLNDLSSQFPSYAHFNKAKRLCFIVNVSSDTNGLRMLYATKCHPSTRPMDLSEHFTKVCS